MTLDDLQHVMETGSTEAYGPLGPWDTRAGVAAVVLALANDIEAAVDYMGSEPNQWANANHRLRALIAEARALTADAGIGQG